MEHLGTTHAYALEIKGAQEAPRCGFFGKGEFSKVLHGSEPSMCLWAENLGKKNQGGCMTRVFIFNMHVL